MTKLKLVAEPNSHEVRVSREFQAPRELVFKAHTDPDLLAKWWGLESSTTTVDKLEAHKGGIWRYIERDTEGNEYIFNGVYHDVQSPERLVNTFEFEGMPGHVLLETITFEEQDGKTLVTSSSVFQSVKDRDGMLQSGMEAGTEENWNRLENLLNTL